MIRLVERLSRRRANERSVRPALTYCGLDPQVQHDFALVPMCKAISFSPAWPHTPQTIASCNADQVYLGKDEHCLENHIQSSVC